MKKQIEIKGVIAGNDYKEIYEHYGKECVCPNDVIAELPKKNEGIEVIMNSGGGHIDAGSEIYTLLKEHKGHVTVKVVGAAASVASVIAMAGDKVIISPTAQMMIHNVGSVVKGDYNQMLREAGVLKEMNKAIANAYVLKTGKSEEEILKLMNKETWYSANTALKEGFVDEVMGVSWRNDSDLLVASAHTANVLSLSLIEEYGQKKYKKQQNTKIRRNFFTGEKVSQIKRDFFTGEIKK